MSQDKKRLGRGLEALITQGSVAKADAKESGKGVAVGEIIISVPVGDVQVNPYQPRKHLDENSIKELSESIKLEGLLQPVVVREKSGKYELIAGERRWRACQSLGMKTIPARVMKANDASSAVMALIENLQREDLNILDEAMGYASLMKDFDLTQDVVAARVGKPRPSIANALRLLKLEKELQGYVRSGMMSAGHAKVLMGMEAGERRVLVGRKIVEEGLSVRDTERLVERMKEDEGKEGKANKTKEKLETNLLKDLQRQMSSFFETSVAFNGKNNRGKIVINYKSNEELNRILEKMGFLKGKQR